MEFIITYTSIVALFFLLYAYRQKNSDHSFSSKSKKIIITAENIEDFYHLKQEMLFLEANFWINGLKVMVKNKSVEFFINDNKRYQQHVGNAVVSTGMKKFKKHKGFHPHSETD